MILAGAASAFGVLLVLQPARGCDHLANRSLRDRLRRALSILASSCRLGQQSTRQCRAP
jgi:hypothetical protein